MHNEARSDDANNNSYWGVLSMLYFCYKNTNEIVILISR